MDIYNGYQRIADTEDEENKKEMVSIGVQTDSYISFGMNIDNIDNIEDIDYGNNFFRHLAFANQTYHEHFCDAIGYSWSSLRASFYFLCHAIWPDVYTKDGSESIHNLSDVIREKYSNRINELITQNISRNN